MNLIQEQLRIGTLLNFNDDNSSWRVYSICVPICYLVKTNQTKRELITKTITSIEEGLASKSITIAEDQDIRFVDETILRRNNNEFNSFVNKKKFIREVEEQFGPTYIDLGSKTRDKEYRTIFLKYDMSRTLANRTVLRWLQSGMQDSSLVSKTYNGGRKNLVYVTKPGRPGGSGLFRADEFAEPFEYGLSLIRKNRLMSINEVFTRILNKYYLVKESNKPELVPECERPTIWQFRRYVNKCISVEEFKKIKTSDREYRNNERILKGAASYKAGLRPGFKIEVDELECDIELVMRNNKQQCIGKPGIYAAIDTYSHCIVAFSVCLETNSNVGLSNLFINLFEDKKSLLEGKGISNFDYSLWPSNFIPKVIRTDNGSDFISKQTQQICDRLGIQRETVEPAMGSLKGNVEQAFNRFHDSIKVGTFHCGYVEKGYDSNHYREACLTLDDVFILMLNFVVYNNKHYTKGRYLTPKMLEEGTTKAPISIWNFGIKHCGLPDMIDQSEFNKCFYNLMFEARATISKKGIVFNDLEYLPVDDEVLLERINKSKINANKKDAFGNRLNSMEIRYDPRSVNTIYYIRNNQIKVLSLKGIFDDYKGKSWSFYESYKVIERRLDLENRNDNEILRIQSQKTVEDVVNKAITPTYADDTNIKESRLIEKEEDNYNNRIETRFEEPRALPDNAQKEDEKKSLPDSFDRGGLDSDSIKKILEQAKNKK